MSTLADRLLAIHRALESHTLPHAFGGAIALAYCTAEPRGTQDLDINVFIDHTNAEIALEALPPEVAVTGRNRRQIATDAQTRAWWDSTPIDLFFNNHRFHQQAAARVRMVPFAGETIPVLDCTSLAVFKSFFDRTKDWADLEAMAAAGQLDTVAIGALLRDLIGDDDHRHAKLAALNGLTHQGDRPTLLS